MERFRAPRATTAGAGYRCTMDANPSSTLTCAVKSGFYTRLNKPISVTRTPHTVPVVIPITVAVNFGDGFSPKRPLSSTIAVFSNFPDRAIVRLRRDRR